MAKLTIPRPSTVGAHSLHYNVHIVEPTFLRSWTRMVLSYFFIVFQSVDPLSTWLLVKRARLAQPGPVGLLTRLGFSRLQRVGFRGVNDPYWLLVNKRARLVQPGPVGLLTRLARLGFMSPVLGLLQGA